MDRQAAVTTADSLTKPARRLAAPSAAEEAENLEDARRILLPTRDARLIVAHVVAAGRRVPQISSKEEG